MRWKVVQQQLNESNLQETPSVKSTSTEVVAFVVAETGSANSKMYMVTLLKMAHNWLSCDFLRVSVLFSLY